MSVIYLSPAYRHDFGFNGALDRLWSSAQGGAPAYDIEKVGGHAYRITLAVPGFAIEDLAITARPNALLVTGNRLKRKGAQHWMQGVVSHGFERRFDLDDHVEVTGASIANGLLTIDLERRLPEPMRSRTIKINGKVSKPSPIAQVQQRALSAFEGIARWFRRGQSVLAGR